MATCLGAQVVAMARADRKRRGSDTEPRQWRAIILQTTDDVLRCSSMMRQGWRADGTFTATNFFEVRAEPTQVKCDGLFSAETSRSVLSRVKIKVLSRPTGNTANPSSDRRRTVGASRPRNARADAPRRHSSSHSAHHIQRSRNTYPHTCPPAVVQPNCQDKT